MSTTALLKPSTVAPSNEISDEKQRLVKKLQRVQLACSALAAIGLACGWRSHRVVGALLGGFVVGPAVGTGAGIWLLRDEVLRLADKEERSRPFLLADVSETR